MSVKIRLTRAGHRNYPTYRLVVADSRAPRDGRFIEIIGRYQPLNPKADEQIYIEIERALEWMKKGAIPSETVRSLFRSKGILKTYHEHKTEQAKARKATRAAK